MCIKFENSLMLLIFSRLLYFLFHRVDIFLYPFRLRWCKIHTSSPRTVHGIFRGRNERFAINRYVQNDRESIRDHDHEIEIFSSIM